MTDTDKELLELAAKAAGLRVKTWDGHTGPMCAIDDVQHGRMWMPLIDDGDALRLAVELLIQVIQDRMGFVKVGWGSGFDSGTPTSGGSGPWYWKEWLSDHNGDRKAATRRAIVRAAAEIGRMRDD
jgi:hypothetical protein